MNKIVYRKRTDAEKLQILEGFNSFNGSLYAYCTSINISYMTVKLWRDNLSKYGKVTLSSGSRTPNVIQAPKITGELEAIKLLMKLGYSISLK